MSTNNLCFKTEIRQNAYPCKPQLYYIKVGVEGSEKHGYVSMMSYTFFHFFRCMI